MALAVAGIPAAVGAQGLGGRVEGVGTGTARFAFGARPGVEICEQGIRMGEHRMQWRSYGRADEPRNCRVGPVEVEVKVRDGRVVDVDVPALERDRAGDAVDVGQVPPAEAVRWLEGVVRGAGDQRAARHAVFPMVLADVPEVWRTLLALARDADVNDGARKNALFWLGQEAADAATAGLAEVARDEDEEQDVRDAAVFALSQRPSDEGIPVLMDVARTAKQAKTRRTAMFWLAQSNDPRVVPFFEKILVGRGGG